MKPIATALCALLIAGCTSREDDPTTMGGSNRMGDTQWGNITAHVWSTQKKQLYYAISIALHPFEPMNPQISYRYDYNIDHGGSLDVNGKPILPSKDPRLLALNPFGEMEEITLTPSEAAVVLQGDAKTIWTDVAMARLGRLEGKTVGGRRTGRWICSDKMGAKGYEGDFVDDLRDGEWAYYYRSGKVRARITYRKGKLDGPLIHLAEDGKEVHRSTWKNDFPLDGPQTYRTLRNWETRSPDGNSSAGSN